jgi:hypothetical protein
MSVPKVQVAKRVIPPKRAIEKLSESLRASRIHAGLPGSEVLFWEIGKVTFAPQTCARRVA